MLVVKIELWPRGDRRYAREIGRAAIGNVTPHLDPASYVVVGIEGDRVRTTYTRGHRRSHGFWSLLARSFSFTTPLPPELEPVVTHALALLAEDQ